MDKQSSTGVFNSVVKFFGPTERILFYSLAVIMFLSGFWALWQANGSFLIEVPAPGGTFTEGVVGSPRFINPLLAIGDTDKSLDALVYSGLLKYDEEKRYIGDLAEHYSISPDGLVYSVKIRENASFHDGKPVTSEDVKFTIEKALDPILKSPRRGNWEGVAAQVIDEKNIKFVLKKPYSPFLENLTLGILPKHIWEKVTSEEFPFSRRNIEPVGSGPYKISRIKYNSSGVPIIVTLKSFNKYVNGKPFINHMEMRFFQNEESLLKAFESGDIDAVAGLSPETAERLKEKGLNVNSYLMPRVFGAFLNQNQASVFLNPEVRLALNESVDKQKLVSEVLKGYGIPLGSPVPSLDKKWTNENGEESEARIERAKKILLDKGWKQNESGIWQKKTKSGLQTLKFSISTSDAPELKKTASELVTVWNKLGAEVEVKVFEAGDLNQNIIKPRKYDVLLFGEVVGRDLDLYPFWHSSERLDPGLNVALYANITADKLLEEIRATTDLNIRAEKISLFSAEVEKDIPTIFIYAPKFIYAISPSVKSVRLESVLGQSDRFSAIKEWYIDTDKVWSIFRN